MDQPHGSNQRDVDCFCGFRFGLEQSALLLKGLVVVIVDGKGRLRVLHFAKVNDVVVSVNQQVDLRARMFVGLFHPPSVFAADDTANA